MALTVGETAQLAKVSVRTLHHYDKLGILSPSTRTDSGYRLYDDGDIERLHRVMVFRELGFSLDEIGRIVADPDFDRTEALRAQRALLAEKVRRTEAMLDAIDAALAAEEGGVHMSDQQRREMFGELFDGFDPAEYEEEVQERWGDTDAYRESAERTKRYTKADWQKIKDEGEAVTHAYLDLMDAGAAPDSAEAFEAAQAHCAYFSKWFYDCSPEMLGNLGLMWVTDQRFTRNIDKAREGLATYQSAVAQAWAASQR